MVFKQGTLLHAKGFIVNKLFDDGRIGGNHLPVQLLPQGYPPKYRHLVKEAFELLKAENPPAIQVVSHRTGRGTSPHVCLVPIRFWPKGVRGLMNGYRRSVGRQPYGRDLKTLLPLRHAKTTRQVNRALKPIGRA